MSIVSSITGAKACENILSPLILPMRFKVPFLANVNLLTLGPAPDYLTISPALFHIDTRQKSKGSMKEAFRITGPSWPSLYAVTLDRMFRLYKKSKMGGKWERCWFFDDMRKCFTTQI